MSAMLLSAAKKGQTAAVRDVLAQGEDVNTRDPSNDATALIWAAIKGYADTVNALLEYDADVNAADKHGLTALIAAAGEGFAPIVEALLAKSADTERTDWWGRTALMCAVLNDCFDCARLLLDGGAKINVTDNKDGWTPLLWAAYRGNIQIIALLIERGADVNARNLMGDSALTWAEKNEQSEIIALLQQAGAKE